MPPLTRKPSSVKPTDVTKRKPVDELTRDLEPVSVFFELPLELRKTVAKHVSICLKRLVLR